MEMYVSLYVVEGHIYSKNLPMALSFAGENQHLFLKPRLDLWSSGSIEEIPYKVSFSVKVYGEKIVKIVLKA